AGSAVPALRRLYGGGDVRREVSAESAADVLIVSVGPFAVQAEAVAERLAGQGISATIVAPRWVLPVPESIIGLAAEHSLVGVLEDGVEIGGGGSQIRSDLREADSRIGVVELCVPDEILQQSSREEILEHVGLDVDTTAARIIRALSAEVAHRAEEGSSRAV